MSRPARTLDLPLREGVAASAVAVPVGPWPTVLDFLAERLPALSRADWHARLTTGDVLGDAGQPVAPDAPCPTGRRLHYWRWHANEPALPHPETVLHQDEWLVVADKPHFLPVTPAGEYVEQTLLRRLIRRLDNPSLVPLHRIDRHTAGLVLFSANPASRSAYQQLFPTRQIDKFYEAIAPALPDLTFPRVHKSRLVDGEPFFRMKEGDGVPNTETAVEVREKNGDLWRYGLFPVTGKKHQLRVHMSALGASICNDPFYPDVIKDAVDDYANPLKLLAQGVRFIDPVTGEERSFRSRITLDW